jgi:TolB protein
MLKNLVLYICCLILFNTLVAEEEIVVRLATESSLTPLYLAPIPSESADLSPNYLQKLSSVLAFDLNHNGSTFLAKNSAANDELALANGTQKMGHPKEWKNQNIYYVVKALMNGKTLTAYLLDVQKQGLKSADPITLTGDLTQDRKSIHRLADTIHKAFFGTDGIASTKLLFSVKNQSTTGVSEIWEVDYDGANPRQLTKEKSYSISPVYIPPKPGFLTGGFLYVSYRIGQPKIYAASTKDGTGKRAIQLKGSQMMPTVSQQRDKIAFISDVTGNPDLFIQNFSPETGPIGKPQQIFSASQATQGTPTFSPDGKKVAFVSNKDGSPKIYVINIPEAGTSLKDIKATLITRRNRENSAPAWSPDGTKIAYCARSSDDRQIWIYDFATNQETQVTSGPGNKENPSWAPNSLHLVFNSADKGNDSQLYQINLNQAEAKQITFGAGDKRFPCWEPRNKG